MVDALIVILDKFTIKKSRKYFIKTKTFIVLQNLLRSVREKLRVDKKILVNEKNFSCVRKKILLVKRILVV